MVRRSLNQCGSRAEKLKGGRAKGLSQYGRFPIKAPLETGEAEGLTLKLERSTVAGERPTLPLLWKESSNY